MIITNVEQKVKETMTIDEVNGLFLENGIISVCEDGAIEKFDYENQLQ